MATKETASRGAFDFAKAIDHTLLKPEATSQDIRKHCEEAKKYSFYAVCVNPCYVSLAKEVLLVSEVKVCTVVGFPLGANETQVKAFETSCAINEGADEIDMVLNIGALKNREYDLVSADIRAVVNAAQTKPVKVILETCLLNTDEKLIACKIAVDSGAQFIKTSTGFSTQGATAEDVQLIRNFVGPKIGVKASGGIRDQETAMKMLTAGANRLGTNSSLAIIGVTTLNKDEESY